MFENATYTKKLNAMQQFWTFTNREAEDMPNKGGKRKIPSCENISILRTSSDLFSLT